jgi:hypothetical protein
MACLVWFIPCHYPNRTSSAAGVRFEAVGAVANVLV